LVKAGEREWNMKKKGGRSNPGRNSVKVSRKWAAPVKTYPGMDNYSDAVMVEVGPNQESQFSIIRGYLKSWKKVLNSADKEKKS
jgi:hypothetical protein